MESLPNINPIEFELALSPAKIRVMQIVQGAMTVGVGLFSLVVVVLFFTNNDERTSTGDIDVLSSVNTVFSMTIYFGVNYIYKKQFAKASIEKSFSRAFTDRGGKIIASTPAEKYFQVIFTATLIRLALMEGAAFFSLAICLIAVTKGVAQIHIVYILNAMPAAIFFLFSFLTFPTKESILNIFQQKIRQLS